MDIDAFITANKSIIIAPAGYGKTYTIAEAIAAYTGNKRILVLTHTHAGIASLKEKFNEKHLPTFKYHLDTICSFALNLTQTYHVNKSEIPSGSTPSYLFNYAIEHATKILRAKPIRQSLSAKFDHLIVDEYQDCTIEQHKLILQLSTSLNTHLLGDPLQGIFGFRSEQIVNFEDESFDPFKENIQELDTPWRWINAGNTALGTDLANIRQKLITGQDINLNDYSSIEVELGEKNDYAMPKTNIKSRLFQELKRDAVLIHPNSTSMEPRKKYVIHYPLHLIESIDGKDYYSLCSQIDNNSGQALIKVIADAMRKVCTKTEIDKWINEKGALKHKSSIENQKTIQYLESIVIPLMACKSFALVAKMIEAIIHLPNVSVYRKEFVVDIIKTLDDADKLGLSATESIIRNRNILRQKGRKIMKKSIGTTLLTKGLEFENVVVLDAQDFKDPRHLYVALTRCCKRLLVITNNPILHPYSNS